MRTTHRATRCGICAATLMAAPVAIMPAGAPESAAGPVERAIVARAIEAAGGRAALEQAATLRWSGDAVVYTSDGRIDLEVQTVVRPFRSAHSEMWLRGQDPATKRALDVTSDAGWIERNGQREPLALPALRHEQQQYAIYGLMRLLPLLDDGVVLRRLATAPVGQTALHVEHQAAPAADLYFDSTGRLRTIEDRVVDPDGGASIAQRIELGGTVAGAPIRWPRTIRILQNGSPYFELTIRRLETGR
jgi:hypothetical protein